MNSVRGREVVFKVSLGDALDLNVRSKNIRGATSTISCC
jgi:hypothetical protein